MTATFVRLFADTSHGAVAELGWSFMRRLIRLIPVRVISVTGGLTGRWIGYEPLLSTPMMGTYVNVVSTDPGRWTWIERVPVATAKATILPGEVARAGGELEVAETITGRQELWTKGVRNVLLVASLPRSQAEIETAKKYDCIVVTTEDHLEWFMSKGMIAQIISHPYPAADVKAAILGGS